MALKSKSTVFIGLAMALLLPQTLAGAAEITDVPDTADTRWIGGRDSFRKTKEDPFDLNIKISFGQHFKNGIISREGILKGDDPNNKGAQKSYNTLVEEMGYKYSDMIMNFEADIGLYHDLGLFVNIPLVINQTHNYRFADDVDTSNSTVYYGASDPRNLINFDPAQSGYSFLHGTGIGNISFTLKWSPLNDERDPSVANWTIGVGYEAPTANLYEPYSPKSITTAQHTAGQVDGLAVGDKAHRINVSLAMSRRMHLPKKYALDPNVNRRGFIDPYFQIFYSLPLAGNDSLQADPVAKDYDGKKSRYQPSHVAGLQAGMEIVAFEDVARGNKVALDIGVYGNYISEGRGYTPLTDALGQLTYYENYMQVGGHFNLFIHMVNYVSIFAGVTVGHETAHFLTTENAGEDRTGDGQVMKNTADYYSPYYNGTWDQIGNRFRIEQILDFSYNVGIQVTF